MLPFDTDVINRMYTGLKRLLFAVLKFCDFGNCVFCDYFNFAILQPISPNQSLFLSLWPY